jgi:16S rRNA (guanine527-N7)-methyltransferase
VDKATIRRLVDGAALLGVTLDEAQVRRFDEYLRLLQTWNRKINLTAITADADVVELHFLDSLAAAPLVREYTTMVDVGCGAGFPGAVLALVQPGLRVTCIDGVAKKIAFLQTLKRTVVPNLDPKHLRDDALEQTFDVAVSRATWDPPVWLDHGRRLVSPGGRLLAMQTGDAPMLEAPAGFEREPAVDYAGRWRSATACSRFAVSPSAG